MKREPREDTHSDRDAPSEVIMARIKKVRNFIIYYFFKINLVDFQLLLVIPLSIPEIRAQFSIFFIQLAMFSQAKVERETKDSRSGKSKKVSYYF